MLSSGFVSWMTGMSASRIATQATLETNFLLTIETAFKPVDTRSEKQIVALTLLRGGRGIRGIATIPECSLPSTNDTVIFAYRTTPDDTVKIPVERNLE
jgi:hypothetical protein